jgi:hypothetical protein
MASQQNTGLVVTLSAFVLLSVALGFFWYTSWADNQTLRTALTEEKSTASGLTESVNNQIAELKALKDVIGRPGEDTTDLIDGKAGENGVKLDGVKVVMADIAANGSAGDTALNLQASLQKTGTDRDTSNYSATDRQRLLNLKTAELQQTIVNMQAQIDAEKSSRDMAESDLRQKETQHSEELTALQAQIDAIRDELQTTQAEYETYKTQTSRQIEDLEDDITQKRIALVALRRKLFEREDLSFERADGQLTFVDQRRLICYLNLGKADELQIGTTFSVYTKNNNGVGRRNTEDIKGKIEVVSLLGEHHAEARIVDQELGRPLAENDPIYSPLFASGQKLQIAVAGLLDFDGNPGSDRAAFERIVRNSGSEITVSVNDVGEIVNAQNQGVSNDELKQLINENTRFLVIGDLGDGVDTQDTFRQAIYRKIQHNAQEMREQALANGVYVISLTSFLEYLGYSRKQLDWNPTATEFPTTMPNGAKSTSADARYRQSKSSAQVSGLFLPGRKRTMQSTGSVSGLFSQ